MLSVLRESDVFFEESDVAINENFVIAFGRDAFVGEDDVFV